ncbi:MAG: triose-phosphate isomerase family protein [Candidatus Paceibacterota bacterium]|jgi:triosephosphate isomerase
MTNKIYIIANWKMNPQNKQDATDLLENISKEIDSNYREKVEVIVLPPYVLIQDVANLFDKYSLSFNLGAQNIFWQNSGAFTGEISPRMIKEIGCKYILIGHSERKIYLGETINMIEKKIKIAIEEQLIPILCLSPRKDSMENFSEELAIYLKNVSDDYKQKIIFVYEPTEAISTQGGKIPLLEELIGMKKNIEKMICPNARIIYGGSVNSSNIKQFVQEAGFNGALVGAKSLDPKEFSSIINQIVQS